VKAQIFSLPAEAMRGRVGGVGGGCGGGGGGGVGGGEGGDRTGPYIGLDRLHSHYSIPTWLYMTGHLMGSVSD